MDNIESRILDVNPMLEKASNILQIEFDLQTDFYKNRHNDIYEQLFLCKNNDLNDELNTFTLGPSKPFSYVKSSYLVSSFLSTIDKKFEEEFWYDFANGSIVMKKDNEKGNSFYFYEDCVYVDITNTITDAFALLHEYLHKLSANVSVYGPNISDNYYDYAEAVSILGEFLFRDFLLDSGVSSYELKLFTDFRKNDFNYELNKTISINPFINLLEEDGSITKRGLDKVKEECDNIDPMRKIFAINSNEDNIFYSHSLGCVVAASLYERNISKSYFCDLIKTLNSSSIEEFEEKLGLSKDYDKNSKSLLKTFSKM